ncbi:MAG: ATP-binding protein [Halanaerobiales bacterium]|nr:ATP-binding protein [Halanaerobiales bacterium]
MDVKQKEMIKNIEKKINLPKNKFDNNKLFMFFGIPGSGKSMIAKEINKRYPSVLVSSDFIAISQNLDYSDKYHWTFEILNYLIDKYLEKGYNVIADSNSDKYKIRKELYKTAQKRGVTPYVFWLDTDIELVKKRQEERNKKDSKDLREEYLFYIDDQELERFYNDIEEPKKWENVYKIDGSKDLVEQLNQWKKNMKE